MTEQLAMRLAIRAEGDFVNAYHAAPDTMLGATLIGSFRRSVLEQQPGMFERWKALVSEAYVKTIEDATGIRPQLTEGPAPVHERSGRA